MFIPSPYYINMLVQSRILIVIRNSDRFLQGHIFVYIRVLYLIIIIFFFGEYSCTVSVSKVMVTGKEWNTKSNPESYC